MTTNNKEVKKDVVRLTVDVCKCLPIEQTRNISKIMTQLHKMNFITDEEFRLIKKSPGYNRG